MMLIILHRGVVDKVINPKKVNKAKNNPNITILEEFEDDIPEERFSYWKSQFIKEEIPEEVDTENHYPKLLYYFINENEMVTHIPEDYFGKIKAIYDDSKYNTTYIKLDSF